MKVDQKGHTTIIKDTEGNANVFRPLISEAKSGNAIRSKVKLMSTATRRQSVEQISANNLIVKWTKNRQMISTHQVRDSFGNERRFSNIVRAL